MPEIGEIRHAREIGRKCRRYHIWLACKSCGKPRWVVASWSIRPTFTNLCRYCQWKGVLNLNWKGGTKNKDGYNLVKVYSDDFFYPMAQKTGYVMEHRLVMAKYLNRCLLSWEVIHHKNGVKDDNCLENLQLLPSGIRHIPSMRLQSRVKNLELKLQEQGKQLRVLTWRVKELESQLAFGRLRASPSLPATR